MNKRRITRTLATLLAGCALAYLAALAIEAYEVRQHTSLRDQVHAMNHTRHNALALRAARCEHAPTHPECVLP